MTTASKAPFGATASHTQKSEMVAVDRAKLDAWFKKITRIANLLGPTDDGFDLALIACEIADAGVAEQAPAERTLETIDRDIALVNVRIQQLRVQQLGMFLEIPKMGLLRLELDKLLLEREHFLLRQRGSDPEKLAEAKLRAFDRRVRRASRREIVGIDTRNEQQPEIVFSIDGRRYRAAISKSTAEAMLSKGYEEIL